MVLVQMVEAIERDSKGMIYVVCASLDSVPSAQR